MERMQPCRACDGTGLLADDENWQYNCTICGGSGVFNMGEIPAARTQHLDVDEMNRTLE